MKTQVLLIILLLFTSLSCVTATDLDNSLNESNNLAYTNNHVINLNHNTHLKSIIKDLNEIYNISETLKNHYTNKINPNNNKRLNTSNNKVNNNKSLINNNFLINPVPEFNNKDNIMFLIPILLVLLGAIIVYKIKK